MNELTQQLLLTGIGGFLIGVGLTWLLTRRKGKQQAELDGARQEMQHYRQEVERHFIDTADAVDELTRSYQKVFTHLSRGAENLMSQEAYRTQLDKRAGQAVTLTYLSHTAVESITPQESEAFERPVPADAPELPQNSLDDISAASNAAPVFNPEQATAENATAVDHTVANKQPSQPEKTA